MPEHTHDDDQLAAAAARLREDRATLLASVAGMAEDMTKLFDASRDSNADDEHDPEGQTVAFERAQLAALTDRAREQLTEIDAALSRVADGSYGICEVGGEPIPAARLEARPTALTCVEHATSRPPRR